MECESPIRLKNPKFGHFPDESRFIDVPCRKCCACQQNHRKMWFFRLKVESDKCVCSYVVTLTYNDNDVPEYVDYNGEFQYHPIKYDDVQAFHKRLRKRIGKFRFFCVCEYGSHLLRPHYHICYFFDRFQDRFEFDKAVFDCWFPDTRITIDTTNDKACNYILKYCLSISDPDCPDVFRPMIRCSTKPFIGHGLLDNQEFLDWLHCKRSDLSHYLGYNQRLPRIFRDKVFSDDEKKFIKKELGRVILERGREKSHKLNDYYEKYGVAPYTWEREQFNSYIRKCAKLKSLK